MFLLIIFNQYGWLVVFLFSWLVFFYLVDWTRFKSGTWKVGVIASIIQLVVDWLAMENGYYRVITAPGLLPLLFNSAPAFTLGPVFTMGILYAQFYPQNRINQVINILVWSILYLMVEVALIQIGALQYLNWHLYDSIAVNIGSLIIISWIAQLMGVFDKKEERQ